MDGTSKLIIAEDELIIALGMELFLTEAGYDICGLVQTAEEAVALGARTRPDLALLDVRLAAGSDGTTAARALQRDHAIPSILVTGHLDADQARACGALGLLKKPYDPKRLLRMIEGALAWHRDGTPPSVDLGLFIEGSRERRRA